MPKQTEKIYWDACCFLAILNNEANEAVCSRIVSEAKEGLIRLFVSPLTMAETVRQKGSSAPIPKDVRDKVKSFFENEYITLVTFNREVAYASLDYCWDFGLHARDALHMSFAIHAGCDAFETTDLAFMKAIPANVLPIEVRQPRGTGQMRTGEDVS